MQVGYSKENKSRIVANSISQKKNNRKECLRIVDNRQHTIISKVPQVISMKSYSKFPPDKKLKPDEIGVENNGIRKLEVEDMRPDDVPLIQPYRLEMHKFLNMIKVLEIATDNNAAEIQKELIEQALSFQKEGKTLAQKYKEDMRRLSSDESVDVIQAHYKKGMEQLRQKIILYSTETKKLYFMGCDDLILKELGDDLWRDNWLTIKESIDNAIDIEWPQYENIIKKAAAENYDEATAENEEEMQQSTLGRAYAEQWKISYIGSLSKGYKGPPKQGTRFFDASFDVDASLDAPLVADYLVLMGNHIDRGQLKPSEKTMIPSMDKSIHETIIEELTISLAKNRDEIIAVLSEPFETRVNVTGAESYATRNAKEESVKEQKVRDALTSLRMERPECMRVILHNIKGLKQYLNSKGDALDTGKHLPRVLLNRIEEKVEKLRTGRPLSDTEKRNVRKRK